MTPENAMRQSHKTAYSLEDEDYFKAKPNAHFRVRQTTVDEVGEWRVECLGSIRDYLVIVASPSLYENRDSGPRRRLFYHPNGSYKSFAKVISSLYECTKAA